MPFVGAEPPRKRRWEDDHGDLYRLYSQDAQGNLYVLDQPQGLSPRKILPLSKRPRFAEDDVHIHTDGNAISPHRRRTSQQKALQEQPGAGNRTANASTTRQAGVSLTPCHICHRRPTKRSDLDSFAECQGCGERACYVCIRECQGWNADDAREVLSEQEVLSRSFCMDDAEDMSQHTRDDNSGEHDHNNTTAESLSVEGGRYRSREGWVAGGHRGVVCSRCCIERGAEGDVVCLGCLSGMEAT